jgi:hypothetical protein
MYYFSLVCTFRKAIKNVEVKIYVKKRVIGFREEIDNRCVSSMQLVFLSVVVIW